jgi:signal transduction histidine kinase
METMQQPEHSAPATASAVLVVAAHELLYRLGRPDLLHEACRITSDALGADLVVALVAAEDGRSFLTKAQYGLSDEEWEAYRVVEFEEPIADAIRLRLLGVELSVLDVSEAHPDVVDDSRRSIARKLGIGPMMLLGLRPGGDLSGILIVCREASKGPFDRRTIDVASGLVPLLAASLENQRLIDDLGAVNRAQADFLASMSHELRTPLHVITGYIEMLLDEQAGALTAEQRTYCERIRASALRQLTLVGETFEMSRRNAQGDVPVRHEALSLRVLLAEIEQEVAVRPPPAAVRLVLSAPTDDVRILSDPVKLGMIVRNLVQNAIKFTPAGEIRVNLGVDDDALVCRVEDTGIGIPASDRDGIFQAFRQVDGTTTSGLGLGLYLVRRLTGALRGTVDVESRLGEGSRFTVRIPLTVGATAPGTRGAAGSPP